MQASGISVTAVSLGSGHASQVDTYAAKCPENGLPHSYSATWVAMIKNNTGKHVSSFWRNDERIDGVTHEAHVVCSTMSERLTNSHGSEIFSRLA